MKVSSAALRTATTTHRGVLLRSGGPASAPVHVWFHPAFGDSEASYGDAFRSPLARTARVFVFDPPGHGASPPRRACMTFDGCAELWRELIRRYSRSKRVVLVGHSMAGVIACRVAAGLDRVPALVIGVEANLTRSDAYLTGLARRFTSATCFHRHVLSRLRARARRDAIIERFQASFERADPQTLWALGRSIAALEDPGLEFRRLRCPRIYYWDGVQAPERTRTYIERHRLPQRRLDHLGHWPMLTAPGLFYAAIRDDIRALAGEAPGLNGAGPPRRETRRPRPTRRSAHSI